MRKFKIPNRLINDQSLSLSARRLGAYLCAASNRMGAVCKSIAMLSGLSGLSPATVQSAAAELERKGYLSRRRQYRFDWELGHPVYDRTAYQVQKNLSGGYTLVPCSLLQKKNLPSSAFVLALYLCQQGADRGRAYPSIQKMMDTVGIARATVCRALKELKAAAVILVQNCLRRNRTFAANSYFYLRHVQRETEKRRRPSLGSVLLQFYHLLRDKINALGSLKFSKPVIELR